jgi:hypothetical protein
VPSQLAHTISSAASIIPKFCLRLRLGREREQVNPVDLGLAKQMSDIARFLLAILRNVNNEESMSYLTTTLDELMKENRWGNMPVRVVKEVVPRSSSMNR